MKMAIYCGKNLFSKVSLAEQKKYISIFLQENNIPKKQLDIYVDDENSCDQLYLMLKNLYVGKYKKLICYDHTCISSFASDLNDVKNAIITTNTEFYEVATKKTNLINDGVDGSKFLFIHNGLKSLTLKKKKKIYNILWSTIKFVFKILAAMLKMFFAILRLFMSLVLLMV